MERTNDTPLWPDPLLIDPLPDALAQRIHADEHVLYAARPIRRAGGLGVWLNLGLGVLFVPAAIGASTELWRGIVERPDDGAAFWLGAVPVALLAVLFVAFALLLLAWPLLSEHARRHSFVVITDSRVIAARFHRGAPRLRTFAVLACDQAAVVRRRGESATLVLRERLKRRPFDGRIVYEWEALHGLPRADDALLRLQAARSRFQDALHGES